MQIFLFASKTLYMAPEIAKHEYAFVKSCTNSLHKQGTILLWDHNEREILHKEWETEQKTLPVMHKPLYITMDTTVNGTPRKKI